jgi:polyribonucleotide nucleotidyltransferase
VAAGTKGGLTMVEGGAKQADRKLLLEALEIAQKAINDEIDMINELVAQVKPVKVELEASKALLTDDLKKEIKVFAYPLLEKEAVNADKKDRSKKLKAAYQAVLDKFSITAESDNIHEAKKYLEEIEIEIIRKNIIEKDIRPDGRKSTEIRQITVDLDILDNVHGSALFTRGQTQSLGVVTLGSSSDVQYMDTLEENDPRRFMLHYNFPPFCTGEVKKNMGQSRREVGHGHLARRAIEAILPDEKTFPYTIRMVSEVLESNGSSSMATVCSSSLALMATGVPTLKQVAGIAMGLIWDKENGKYKILSDIQGLEDHFGDMDFKVAGSSDGITGFQMDVKTIGITKEMMSEAIEQAWAGKEFILSKMNEVIAAPRSALSPNAPKIRTIQIPETEIGSVIGGGGRVIKKIMAETDVSISIEDNGQVMITSKDEANIEKAVYIVEHIVNGFKKGDILEGTVSRIEDYGVFVELIPGQSGLVHKSNFATRKNPRDAFKLGDKFKVKVIDIDEKKRLALGELSEQ